jgi:putative DNA primase/helicase
MTFDVSEIRAANPLEIVAGHYTKLTKNGNEWRGACPIHGGDNPSAFAVYTDKNGVQRFACYTNQCHEHETGADVIGFIQQMENLDFQAACSFLGGKQKTDWNARIAMPSRPKPAEWVTTTPPVGTRPDTTLRHLGSSVKEWDYLDETGALLGVVARYETESGKEYRQWTYGSDGNEPAWGCKHFTKPRPLYALNRLAAKPEATVVICEGEKAADAAAEILTYHAAVTWPGGASAWRHANFAPLRGRKILLWPDNDEPGAKAMHSIGTLLAGMGCLIRMIVPADVPAGHDAADALETLGQDAAIEWLKAHAVDFAVTEPPGKESDNPKKEAEQNAPETQPDEKPDAVPTILGVTEDNAQNPRQNPSVVGDSQPDAEVTPIKRKPNKKPRLAAVNGNTALAPDPDAEPMPEGFSEDDLAERFVAMYGQDWRYVKRWNRWFYWDQTAWKCDDTESVFATAKLIPRIALTDNTAMQLTADGRRKLTSRRVVGNLCWFVGSHPTIAATVDQWDTDIFKTGCPTGTIDLLTGKVIESEREDYITKRTSVSPADGDCPLWLKFMGDVTKNDQELIAYLQRFCGYALSGDVTEHALLYLYGTGGNGKGVFTDTISAIMGNDQHGYAYACPVNVFMSSKSERHPTELAALNGARLVHSEEPDGGAHWDEGRIKWLTGEGVVTARFLSQEFFTFKPVMKLLLQGNNKPRLKSVDNAMKRRFHIVPFSVTVAEPDPRLREKLRDEYPQILAWMMRGFLQWREVGLAPPAVVTNATREYLATEDALGSFLDECCELGDEYETDATEAYQRYARWAEQVGEPTFGRRRWSNVILDRNLAHPASRRTMGRTMLRGFRVREHADMPPVSSYSDQF